MSSGELKEVDSPYNLLQDTSSLFYNMVQKTGPSASKKLQQMALVAHLAKKSKPWTINSGLYNDAKLQVLFISLYDYIIAAWCDDFCPRYSCIAIYIHVHD